MYASYAEVGSTVAAGFLCVVFARAIVHKLGAWVEFCGNVRDYRIVPARLVPLAARIAVGAETLTVVGLALPQTRIPAAMLATLLLIGYGCAIALNLQRGRTTIDCGCGGSGQGISGLHLLRNGVLVLFVIPVFGYQGTGPIGVAAMLAVSGCVLSLWITFVIFDQILGNRTHANATTYSAL